MISLCPFLSPHLQDQGPYCMAIRLNSVDLLTSINAFVHSEKQYVAYTFNIANQF